VYAMEILLAVLGAGAIGVNLFGLVLCLLAKGWVRNPVSFYFIHSFIQLFVASAKDIT